VTPEVLRLSKELGIQLCLGSPGLQLSLNHGATAAALRKWSKFEFGFCQYRIQELTNLISEIQGKPVTEENARREAYLQSDLNEWLIWNDLLWKQKSRELWLKNGDRNTKFFHLSTSLKRRHNSIDAIKTEKGVWIIDAKLLREFISEKFEVLFKVEDVNFPQDLDNLIPLSITVAENDELNSILSPVEIKSAIFIWIALRPRGLMGFPHCFISIIGLLWVGMSLKLSKTFSSMAGCLRSSTTHSSCSSPRSQILLQPLITNP
jgi:hypothetical protein